MSRLPSYLLKNEARCSLYIHMSLMYAPKSIHMANGIASMVHRRTFCHHLGHPTAFEKYLTAIYRRCLFLHDSVAGRISTAQFAKYTTTTKYKIWFSQASFFRFNTNSVTMQFGACKSRIS